MDKPTIIILMMVMVLVIVGSAFGAYICFLPSFFAPQVQVQDQVQQQVEQEELQQPAGQLAGQKSSYPGWKKYANEEYGFSFEYPEEWTTSTVNSPASFIPVTSFSADKFFLKVESSCCREGQISYKEFPIQLGTQELEYKLYGYAEDLGKTNISSDNPGRFALLSVPASLLKTKKDLNGQGVEIEMMFNVADEEKAVNLFNQILSTFKFTK
jgi:hypothetical protein